MRLRTELLIAPQAEGLVALFAAALAEHGVDGHFCIQNNLPLLGDTPTLIGRANVLVVDCGVSVAQQSRMLLAAPRRSLSKTELARLRGYAELYTARAIALQEHSDDVRTDCGLSLRERYVLGRRLAGLAPIDIALESGLTVATVSKLSDAAVERLGVGTLAQAIAHCARRGWLAITTIENCSSSMRKTRYKVTENG